jgi:hypothetical protein
MVRRESRDAAVVRCTPLASTTDKEKKRKKKEKNEKCCYVPSLSWMFFVDKQQRENVCCKAA